MGRPSVSGGSLRHDALRRLGRAHLHLAGQVSKTLHDVFHRVVAKDSGNNLLADTEEELAKLTVPEQP